MKPLFPLTGCLLGLFCSVSFAQTVEEYELTKGRRVSAASVKPTATGFSATLVTGVNAENITFTTKDIIRTTLQEPAELRNAKFLVASGKFAEAIDVLTKVEDALEPFRKVPGSWWYRAVIQRMDALAAKGSGTVAAAVVKPEILVGLPEEATAALTDFQSVIAKPTDSPESKIAALQGLANRTTDPWMAARAWLEVGNAFANQGKMEEAIKAWLRVAVFHPAERDLAVRGTILAARGMQQIERPLDGVKLLDDYLSDQIASPYESTITAEKAKIEPKRETKEATPAAKDPDTPAAPAENDSK